MCSISGVIVNPRFHTNSEYDEINKLVIQIALNGADRGRDACGFARLRLDGGADRFVFLSPVDETPIPRLVDENTIIVINNNRNAPTTEGLSYSKEDVQPFTDGVCYVAHNGVVANDKLLRSNFGIETKTGIDSAVLPFLLNPYVLEPEPDARLHDYASNIFTKICVGSFAIAWFYIAGATPSELALNTYTGRYNLWLYRDFKPLVLARHQRLGCIFFSSEAKNIDNVTFPVSAAHPYASQDSEFVFYYPPPYTLVKVTPDLRIEGFTNPREPVGKALIVCSGGLDSTTVAMYAKWTDEQNITLVHFLYGCRAEEPEKRAIENIAQELDCGYQFEDLSFLKRLGGSNLTDFSKEVAKGDWSAETPDAWVPARNTVMMSLTAAICDVQGQDRIYLGNNIEEGGAFCDNSMEFFRKMGEVFDLGTISRPTVHAPVGNLTKHEIVRTAIEIGAPVHLSYSCYHEGPEHCGECGPCSMRMKAFRINGWKDPMSYKSLPEEDFWRDCLPVHYEGGRWYDDKGTCLTHAA